jgi:trigger factor
MQTTVEETAPHVVKLTVEVPADEFGRDLDRTYRAIANQIKVPGFRKGKVPKQIIDTQVGRDAILEEFVSSSVPAYFRRAVTDEDLAPITDPEIDVQQLEPGKPLIFSATVEVRPRLSFEESDYTGITVTKPSIEVTEADIDDWIERLRERFSELEPVGRPVQQGDFVTVDLTVTKGGEKVQQASREDYLYFVGSGEVGDKLDVELAGAKPGAILKVSDALPERFGDELGGAAVEITVLVKDVKTRRLPDVDDEFAKTVSEFDTLSELQADLRERLEQAAEQQAEAALRERVIEAFVEHAVEVELPEGMVALEVDGLIESMARMLGARGVSLEQYLEHENIDLDALRQRFREQAERNLVLRLGLDEVGRAERIEVTEQHRTEHIEQLAARVGQDAQELQRMIAERGDWESVDGDIIRAKALDLLVERANVVTEEGST